MHAFLHPALAQTRDYTKYNYTCTHFLTTAHRYTHGIAGGGGGERARGGGERGRQGEREGQGRGEGGCRREQTKAAKQNYKSVLNDEMGERKVKKRKGRWVQKQQPAISTH